MAKQGGDSNKIRDEEVTIETKAAYAGKGDMGGSGSYSMPAVESDNALGMCQAAADAAKAANAGEEENAGSGTDAVEDYD